MIEMFQLTPGKDVCFSKHAGKRQIDVSRSVPSSHCVDKAVSVLKIETLIKHKLQTVNMNLGLFIKLISS